MDRTFRHRCGLWIIPLSLACGCTHVDPGAAQLLRLPDGSWRLGNRYLSRTLSVRDGRLRTVEIENRRAGRRLVPAACDEFALRISEGTDRAGTDIVLTAKDFRITKSHSYTPSAGPGAKGLAVALDDAAHGISVALRYELADDDFYMHKFLEISCRRPWTLERVDVESLAAPDAQQPYTVRQINARGKWSPGLGQPLYTTASGTFWGVEFPAADNAVRDGTLTCGYLRGLPLEPGTPYTSYPGVVGVADDPNYTSDAFYAYIDRIRVRPLRLQIQYNTWFDTGRGVNRDSFRRSLETLHRELVEERGNEPLSAYVIDDGWQDTRRDWTKKTWQVNNKFDPDFASSRATAAAAGSSLGLWLSPGCLFGASSVVGKYRAGGFEALDDWMSLAGPKYMQLLEDRMVELTAQGITYFKLDGLFGHLNTRNFELHGGRYGLPQMPQLGLDGIRSGDAALNDPKYDELKIYYLTAGTERLMRIFRRMAAVNPDVYIVISNGAYLSPWWLQYVDAVWMINAGDAAGGSNRTQELVYRDGRYYEIWQQEHTQFPMHSIFNHEPKKRRSGESKEEFRSYLYMSLSRGTGFIELYVKPAALHEYDWDVISEGLLWARDVFPLFKRSRMHGGDPRKGEVYGYTAWNTDRGYVSIHNPAGVPQTYSFTLDRSFGLLPDSGSFYLSSPLADSVMGLQERIGYGEQLTIELQPREIRIINFDRKRRDWDRLRALQIRHDGPAPPPPAKPIGDHQILGTWAYTHAGKPYTRTFGKDGICTLKQGDEVQWRKPFVAKDERTVVVEGQYVHVLTAEDTLRIENRYTAKRR